MLSIQQLICKRDGRALFAPLMLEVNAGDCIEVRGPNGAGKTTLLRTLAGLHTQYEGGFNCSGFLYQGHRTGLDELMSPVENLHWYGAMQGFALQDSDIRLALLRTGILGSALIPCQRLSQGQQRRVCMARWLLSPARLWLLDEPYTSLDKAGQRLLNELLTEHRDAGGAVVATTHVPLTVGERRALEIIPEPEQCI